MAEIVSDLVGTMALLTGKIVIERRTAMLAKSETAQAGTTD